MRAFSSFPPFNARAPGILPTSSKATCLAFSSSLQTSTSQSTGASPASTSAPRFWNAAATLTPRGKSSFVCSAAEPCQTPSTRVAAPPTVAASGTVVSIAIVPGFHTFFNCLSSGTTPEKGTVKMAISQAAVAEGLSVPSTCAASPMRSRKSLAVSCARPASREPIRTCSPALAIRNASPEPSAPVPPRIAIFRVMMIFSPFKSSRAARSYTRAIFLQHPPLRIPAGHYGIFKNSKHENAIAHSASISQGSRPLRNRNYHRHRGACFRLRARDDRQFLHFGFARPLADSDLCRKARGHSSYAGKEKTLWRERVEGRSRSHLRILRKRRAECRGRAALVHSLSLDS